MAKKRSKLESPFLDRWHIVSMSNWDEGYFNEEVQAFIEFQEAAKGEFQFGYVQGIMDCREGLRDGEPCVEWSWEGTDGADMTPMSGRGWAKLSDEGLDGMIFIHQGDQSQFEAERVSK
jgi:hypothetical protein